MELSYKGWNGWNITTFDYNRNGNLNDAIFSAIRDHQGLDYDDYCADIIDLQISSSDNSSDGDEYDFVTVVYVRTN